MSDFPIAIKNSDFFKICENVVVFDEVDSYCPFPGI